jgi:hypothetical protein
MAVGVAVSAGVGACVGEAVGVAPGVGWTAGVALGSVAGFGGAVGVGFGATAPMVNVVVARSEPELVLAEMRPVPFAAPLGTMNLTPNDPRVAAVNLVTTAPL